jgi:hypothetical protein
VYSEGLSDCFLFNLCGHYQLTFVALVRGAFAHLLRLTLKRLKTALARAMADCLLRRSLTTITRVFTVAILNEDRVSEEAHAKRHLIHHTALAQDS